MPFNFNNIQSVEFGVCLDGDTEEIYRMVPADQSVQIALGEMLEATHKQFSEADEAIADFSPAEKYSSTGRLRLSLDPDFVTKHKVVFESENLQTDTHGLDAVVVLPIWGLLIENAAKYRLSDEVALNMHASHE